MNYKVGDKVEITANKYGHQFKIGEIIKIVTVYKHDYKGEGKDGEWWWIGEDEIKLVKDKKQTIMNQNQLIKLMTDELLQANNTVSTLEVKKALRKRYSNQAWYQQDVSDELDRLQSLGFYTYSDTGTYRVYSFSTVTKTKRNAAATPVSKVVVGKPAKTKATKVAVSKKKISKSSAIKLIQESNNRFFGVTFTKKDGTTRKMTCRLADPKPNNLGYLLVLDIKESDKPKSLNLQTLSELRINKVNYSINA